MPSGRNKTRIRYQAFVYLFGTVASPSRLGRQWLCFFDIPVAEWGAFWTYTLLACVFHDMGKANSGFQGMLLRKGQQVIRHEHLSALLLCLPEVRSWLEGQGVDFGMLLSAVLCHHLKVAQNNVDFAAPLPPAELFNFMVYGEGVHEHLCLATEFLGVTPPCPEVPEQWNVKQLHCEAIDQYGETPLTSLYSSAARTLRRFRKMLSKDTPRRNLLQAVRSALIIADSAGSGLMRESKPLKAWLKAAFSPTRLLDREAVEQKILRPRMLQVEARTGQPFHWKDFQLAADTLPQRALLLAACGSGKTLTAWRWIAAQLHRTPKSRVIFLYPTRATAAEGFRDYVSWAPEADAAPISGAASTYELERMFDDPDEIEKKQRNYTTEQRLFAIGYWQKRIFSSTVHQFLGFMQHAYASTCLLPVLVDSIVVFDEVHSFDTGLFSALYLFLKRLQIPALCMTATLPPERSRKLEEDCGLEHLALFKREML